MTALVHKCVRSFPNNAALARCLRVHLSGGYLAAAGITDNELGVMEELSLAADSRGSVRLPGQGETVRVTAASGVTQYAEIYAAASGKISATPSGPRWGIALEAASGDGSQIEALRLPGGAAGGQGSVVVEEVTFTEAGDTTYTGTVNIPAGATILDIQVRNTALWDDGTSAVMKVGDAADDDGWFTGVNVKATDLLVGEVLNFNNLGGKDGAYITAASGAFTKSYNAAATVVTGVITTGAQDGTAGRTRMVVVYSVPNVVAATGA